MALKEMFVKFINEYASELADAKANEDYKRPFGDFVRQDIAGFIRDQVDEGLYKVKGSVGAGRWTDVPWIAIFDKRITTSAQRGVYIVFLLNKDDKELYLTLNQGATNVAQGDSSDKDVKLAFTGIATASNDKTTNSLKNKAAQIRETIGDKITLAYGDINTGSKAYDAGCIYYKKYKSDDMPEDEELCSDIADFVDAYKSYYDLVYSGTQPDWWPSLEEYTPGFSVEDWVDLLNDPSIFKENYLAIMKRMKDIGGSASCSQLADKYGESKNFYNSGSSTLAEYIAKSSGCSTDWKDKNNARWWPILYQGREAQKDEVGGYIYKLRDELSEALDRVDLSNIPLYAPGKEVTAMTDKQKLDRIKNYIAWKGFSYTDGLIENFYLSLRSKPFVILAGTSGTGKTRLVKLFAEAIGAEYTMVPVRPDWSDSSDLFGHLNLNGDFIPGAIIEFISAAQKNPERPYILCLDEMNLARVEYYLSDFLSVIETRELNNGVIESAPLVPIEKYGSDETAINKYGEVRFPQNLYIVGTVNMDETTFPFSKKVLDRANTIEFSYVNLVPDETGFASESSLTLGNDFLVSEYLFLSQCQDSIVNDVCSELQEINEILRIANAHVGYRVRDEIVFYMLNNKNAGLLSDTAALDNEIMQKILPRIQGSSSSVKNMLCELFKKFAGDYDGYQTQSDDTYSKMMKKLQEGKAVYPHSAEKVAFMVRRFEEDGFTSYWL